ncbi:MAG: nitroreductase family protein [Clostridiaceae bacterium]|nr:nitroreductase family protein [Clostridiaceae bacterium]
MEIIEAIKNRHSVRDYSSRSIEELLITELQREIDACNKESGLHIQLITEEPKAFGGFMAHYGKIKGVNNYIALVGPKTPQLDEKIGYYGERVALKAQTLGLNTCWVALTYSKGKSRHAINSGEKLVCVLALGYGKTQGTPHKSKPMESLCLTDVPMPEWFNSGMKSALLAPTAINQQKFLITLSNGKVSAKTTGGFYSKVDLGIVKYHFEIGAGKASFDWQE